MDLCGGAAVCGGWTLLMKASDRTPTTFEYSAAHWIQPTTLNPEDVSLDNRDAKYSTFNNMQVTELLANFPDLGDSGMQWRVGRFIATTALDFFQTPATLSTSPLSLPEFRSEYFSHQDGAQLYAIDHDGGNAQVRWGFSWNNEAIFGSNDVVGGIGLSSSRDAAAHFSAGDGCYCCGSCRVGGSEGSTATYRVQIFGRYDRVRPGLDGVGSMDQPAQDCQQVADSGATESGVYFVGIGSRVRRRWCNLDYNEGDGWSELIMHFILMFVFDV